MRQPRSPRMVELHTAWTQAARVQAAVRAVGPTAAEAERAAEAAAEEQELRRPAAAVR